MYNGGWAKDAGGNNVEAAHIRHSWQEAHVRSFLHLNSPSGERQQAPSANLNNHPPRTSCNTVSQTAAVGIGSLFFFLTGV